MPLHQHTLKQFTGAVTFSWFHREGWHLICYVHHWPSSFVPMVKVQSMESIALRAATVMPILLLQKPHAKSKTYEHVACLERCMASWHRGDIDTLVQEGRTIQRRFRLASTPSDSNHQQLKTRKFAKLMSQGKVKAALQLLEKTNSGAYPMHSSWSTN